MRISTKCSVALHILLLLAVFRDQKLTSEILAKSTGCNPVVVRNLLGCLKKAGIVSIQRGSGGATVCASPEDISVWTVFAAVDQTPLESLVGVHPSPSSLCPVGKNIRTLLEEPYGIVANAMRESMSSYTLRQIIDNYYSIQN